MRPKDLIKNGLFIPVTLSVWDMLGHESKLCRLVYVEILAGLIRTNRSEIRLSKRKLARDWGVRPESIALAFERLRNLKLIDFDFETGKKRVYRITDSDGKHLSLTDSDGKHTDSDGKHTDSDGKHTDSDGKHSNAAKPEPEQNGVSSNRKSNSNTTTTTESSSSENFSDYWKAQGHNIPINRAAFHKLFDAYKKVFPPDESDFLSRVMLWVSGVDKRIYVPRSKSAHLRYCILNPGWDFTEVVQKTKPIRRTQQTNIEDPQFEAYNRELTQYTKHVKERRPSYEEDLEKIKAKYPSWISKRLIDIAAPYRLVIETYEYPQFAQWKEGKQRR